MDKDKAIRILKNHGMQCGHDVKGVWAVEHWVQMGTNCQVSGSNVVNLESIQDIKIWLGY